MVRLPGEVDAAWKHGVAIVEKLRAENKGLRKLLYATHCKMGHAMDHSDGRRCLTCGIDFLRDGPDAMAGSTKRAIE